MWKSIKALIIFKISNFQFIHFYECKICKNSQQIIFFQSRYSKRPLRGPYGQMLEAEMAKPRTTDIALEEGLRPRRKISANLSYNAGSNNSGSEPPTPCHHRTTSSPTKLDGLPGPSPELLAELLRGSSERVARAPAHRNVSKIILLRYKLPVTIPRLHFAHFSRFDGDKHEGGPWSILTVRAAHLLSKCLMHTQLHALFD